MGHTTSSATDVLQIFAVLNHRETRRIRKANQPNNRQVGFKFLKEAEYTEIAPPSSPGWPMYFAYSPMMMWLGYVIGSQRAG